MKKFIKNSLLATVLVFGLTCPACAIGKLEDAADALEDAEEAIDDLYIEECMAACDADAAACFDFANNDCINRCETENDYCHNDEDDCLDIAREGCSVFSDAEYDICMEQGKEACDYDCDKKFSDCGQQCGDELSDCFFGVEEEMDTNPGFSACVRECIDDIEQTLKNIDI